MKQNNQTYWLLAIERQITIGFLLVSLFLGLAPRMKADDGKAPNYENIFNIYYHHAAVTPDDIILSINILSTGKVVSFGNTTNTAVDSPFSIWDETSSIWRRQQAELILKLVSILSDPKSDGLKKCAAVYYLADMRSPNAVDALAANITLQFDGGSSSSHRLPIILPGENISVDALVQIGNPSIPAVIRNLAESDDVKVRELSLKVLSRIEGDKDIVQLRLQKALAAEKDSQKQARLQAALKSLSETTF